MLAGMPGIGVPEMVVIVLVALAAIVVLRFLVRR